MSADPIAPFTVSAKSATTVYRSVRKIASGGMGSVELAVAASGRSLGRMVAVKRLHPHLEEDERFLHMFFDELAITASLHHPHIVEIVDWGKDDLGHFLVLEYVPGDSLFALARDAQKRRVPFPVGLALYVVARTAEGLHAAHELRDERGESRHLVHRDVSHSNVLVSIHGQVTLIDFGVAKARDNLTHTAVGTVKGKLGYLSPEQYRGEAADRRSDLFSLGVVLWELLSGQRLFHGATEWEGMRRTLEHEPTALHTEWPEVPAAVDRALARALAKSRDDRMATCQEFADTLDAIARDEGIAADEESLARYFRESLPGRVEELERLMVVAQASVEEATAIHRDLPVLPLTVVTAHPAAPRRAWWPVALAAVVAVGAGLTALALRRPSPPPPAVIDTVHPVALPVAPARPIASPAQPALAPVTVAPPPAAPERRDPRRHGPSRRHSAPIATPAVVRPVAPTPTPASNRPQLDTHW